MLSSKDFLAWMDRVTEKFLRRGAIGKAADAITRDFFAWARRWSLHGLHFGIQCCALEFAAASAPRFDAERFGVIYRSSPRQSDVLIINGPVTKKLRPALRRLYDQMAEPKWVIAMGECSISGGPYWQSYNVVQGADQFIPVDVYIPGCPVRPEGLIEGFIKLQEKIRATAKGLLTGEAAQPVLLGAP